MSDKTEQATPKRLRKAREEGDSGHSAFAAQAVAFVVAVAVVPAAVRAAALQTRTALEVAISHASQASPGASIDAGETAIQVIGLSVPVLLATLAAGAVASLVQTGGFFTTKKLSPKLERLNPIEGLRGLVSSVRLFAVARALVLAGSVGYLAYDALRVHAVDLARLTGRLRLVGWVTGTVAHDLAMKAAILALALGALDVVVVRRLWRMKLRMTKEETKREHKESEGDPHMKAARERAHRERMASAVVASVRTASVLVVNPTHLACALRYDENEGDVAPVVVASGQGELAQQMVQAARDYGVPIVRDVPLARALIELETGEAIPEVLYETVADILREAWAESEAHT